MDGIWSVATIAGPIVLGAGLIYGIYHSRRRLRLQPRIKFGTIYSQE